MDLINNVTDERRIEGMKEIEKAAQYTHREIDPLLLELKDKLEMFEGADFVRDIIKGQMLLFIGTI